MAGSMRAEGLALPPEKREETSSTAYTLWIDQLYRRGGRCESSVWNAGYFQLQVPSCLSHLNYQYVFFFSFLLFLARRLCKR